MSQKNNPAISSLVVSSPLGPLLIQAQNGEILSVEKAKSRAIGKNKMAIENGPTLKKAAQELTEFFAGSRRKFSLQLATEGTEFQKKVWSKMSQIPYGKTISYKDLAKKVGRPLAARAVGQACNRNRHLILVPCHRVLATGGSLGGFALGLSAKKSLLSIERERQ